MKTVSKSTDNVLTSTVGIITNNRTFAWNLTGKKLKLYIIYTDSSTPHLSQASIILNNLSEVGGITLLPDQEGEGKGKFTITLSAADLEKFDITSISGLKLYLALYELKTIGNITTAETYLPVIKPDLLLEIVP
jgi:hypothetical protein